MPEGRITKSHAALDTETTIALTGPKALGLLSPVLSGSNSLALGSGAVVVAANSPGSPPVVSMGGGGLHAEPDVVINDAWSRGTAELRDRVAVHGVLHASSTTLGNDVVIDGGIDTSPAFDPTVSLSWSVQEPAGTATNVDLEPDQSAQIAVGRFGTIRVATGATLTLGTGTYYVDTLQLEPQSVVALDQKNGPIVIYVGQSVQLRGAFSSLDGSPPDLLLAYLGTSTVFVESRFDGAIIAPFSALVLRQVSGTHTGFFSAKDLQLDANARVAYRVPLAMLTAANPGVQECADLVPVRQDLAGKERKIAYQRDIARYCTMPGASDCQTYLTARANVEFTAAAGALFGQTSSPAQYLAIVRDRTRKYNAAEDDPLLAAALCAGDDTDNDWIPNAHDTCPDTPELTPTDDAGCTDSRLPAAPDADQVHQLLLHSGFVANVACKGAAVMPKIPAGGFYYPGSPERGTFILSGRVTNQPAGCPVWYFFDIEEMRATSRTRRYLVAFRDAEESTALIGSSKPVPPGFIQFNPLPGDAGTRGQLATVDGNGVRFRVRAMNGAGLTSGWSEWKVTTNEDCLALGFTCG